MKAQQERHETDEELALLAAASPDSFEGRRAAGLVLERYTKLLYGWCYTFVHDRDQAEDLAQDILLRAYSRLGEFEGWGRFSAWLFTIGRNVCLDAVRRSARRRSAGEAPDFMPDPRPGPDAELERNLEERELLEIVRAKLTRLEQDAVWLRCVERMPVEAITRALKIPKASGARAVLQTARRKLRSALGSRFDHLEEGHD